MCVPGNDSRLLFAGTGGGGGMCGSRELQARCKVGKELCAGTATARVLKGGRRRSDGRRSDKHVAGLRERGSDEQEEKGAEEGEDECGNWEADQREQGRGTGSSTVSQ